MFQIWSLNGARFVADTPGEISRTLTWLKSLSLPDAIVPDVLCLQDFRVSLLKYLRPLPYFSFVPMTNHMHWGMREALGVCIASRWPLTAIDVHHSWGHSPVRDLEGVDANNFRIKPDELSDRLVAMTENRVGIACTVRNPLNETAVRIATHHGFWTRDGIPTSDQITSAQSMATFLSEQARKHDGIVYLADYNPDKQGIVHDIYVKSGGIDCLPTHFATTLAASHPAARLGVRSDCVMVWPGVDGEPTYEVSDVHLDPSPGSDHLMVCCSIHSSWRISSPSSNT